MSAAASTAKARSAAKSGGRARSQAKPAGTRGPLGANREAVLAVVRERPGATAREVTAASGVTGGTLNSLLARLIARGELAKRDLPGGQTGYALADSDASATAAAGADTSNEDSSPTGDTATAEDQPAEDRPESDEV